MSFARSLSCAFALALVLIAGLADAASGRERSLAVYPKQVVPLRFDHALHLSNDLECVSCHDTARKSVSVSDNHLPKHPECENCHDIEAAASTGQKQDPPAECSTCHLSFDKTVHREPPKVNVPNANLKFNHKVHVEKKVDCVVCHGSMKDVGLATRNHLPKMDTCLVCHDNQFASATCKTCHPVEPSGRLTLAFASGLLRPMQGDPFGMDHGPRFEFTHGTKASMNQDMCMSCHAQRECQVCHDALQKPLAVHPNDYITLHPVQARADSYSCTTCHRTQSFCAACHERAGVGLNADKFFASRNVRVHPEPAIWTDAPNPQHHGIVASRDMNQCTACHREESCTACHAQTSTRRTGVNPHPNNFAVVCKQMAARNDRACLKCHTEDQIAQKGCR